MNVLAATNAEGWQPGIGDPTIAGWVTVVLCFLAAVLCWRRVLLAKRLRTGSEPGDSLLFWCLLAAVMLFLAINKQLDLQTLLTEIGRNVAIAQGWYEQRGQLQLLFVVAVAFMGGIILIGVLCCLRGLWRSNWLAIVGVIMLLTFVVIRAASFHHVDTFLGVQLAGLRVNSILEISGILCIIAGTLTSPEPRR